MSSGKDGIIQYVILFVAIKTTVKLEYTVPPGGDGDKEQRCQIITETKTSGIHHSL